MFKKVLFLAALVAAVCPTAIAGDLYMVVVDSHEAVRQLTACEVDAVLRVTNGYLVLADDKGLDRLSQSGLTIELVASDVNRSKLAIDIRRDDSNRNRYQVLHEADGMRLFDVDPALLPTGDELPGLAWLGKENLPIVYREPRLLDMDRLNEVMDLDSLIDLVNQDSLESYVVTLTSYWTRVVETSSNIGSRFWIVDKLTEFGYDSIIIDSGFAETRYWEEDTVKYSNVVCVKVGTEVPSREIVIGAHRDAVPFSPGADDNASGTCAVLEIARVLNNIDTRLTIKFVLFDAEEVGLCGSKHYAADAASRGDQIVIMLNMDMIASIGSMDQAMVLPFPFGTNPYGQLWGTLADSLEDISIAANVTEPYGPKGSDHFFFYIYGYDAMEISEGSLSPVYHSPNDSIEYMDLDYYTRMTKASLATAFVAAATYWAEPTLVFEHPLDDPPLIYPGLDTQMVVALSTYSGEEIVPFSGQLHYSVDDGPFVSIPLNDLGSADFGATIPGQSCHSVVKYYFSAEGVQSGVAYHPDTASPIIKNVVTEIDVAFHDNFQFDLGWTVVGDATFGMWERAFPDGGVGAPEGDYDSSGYYNLPDRSMCYLTEQDGLYDVDHGVTNLYSPIIDLTYERAEVEYAIWFSNSSEANPYSDDFRVHVSPNGGQSWALLQQLGPVENADGGWELYRFQLDEIMPMPASVQFVFHAEDLGADSRVEAAVDAFRITQSTCDPRIITEQLSNGIVNEPYSQTLSAAGGDGVFTWSDLFDDLSGTGITLSAQGMLSGTPGDAGTFSFTAHAEDQAGDFHERAFDIWVSPLFICGDIDGSGGDPDIGDLVYLVDYMFAGGPPPPVVAAADVDGSGAIDIADLVYMVDFMFGGGPPPVCE